MKTKSHTNNSAGFRRSFFRTPAKLLVSALGLGMLFAGALLLGSSSPAKAAACVPPSTTYGTDTMSNVTVSTAGTYNIWVRMKAPATTSNQIMLQVTNGGAVSCFNVGGLSSMPVNTWTWLDYQNGSTTSLNQVTLAASPTTFEFIGTETGVQIDRVELLSPTDPCAPPTGTGDNCTISPLSSPFYMMAGTTSPYTDTSGTTWQADQYFTQDNTFGSTGGLTKGGDGTTCTTSIANSNCTATAITGAADSKVYQTERWGSFHYDIPVASGSYTVVLKFAEINPSSGRTFNVSIEGTQVLTNFNIAGQVGNYTADDQTFPVTVTNNDLNITFVTVTNSAKIDAIEVLPSAPPTVSITAPTANSTVNGTAVPLSVALGNTSGSTSVVYKVDGTTVATSTTSPYSATWNSTSVADGSHSITATVTSGGLTTTSSAVNVTVANNVCSAAPTAPSGLTTSGVTASNVTVNWVAPAAVTNCTISGYNIYRSTTQNGTYTKLNASPVNALTYPDATVSAGTTYFYEVTTVFQSTTNASGTESAKSASTSATTNQTCSSNSSTKPTAPTATQLTTGTSYTQIAMSWSASTVNNGCTLSGYHVYRVNGSNQVLLGSPSANTTNFTDTGSDLAGGNLASGTTYNYLVVAFDSGGNISANTTTVAMSTTRDNVAPTIPAGLAANSVTSNSLTLTWSASTDLPNPGAVGVAGYNIYVNDSATRANGSLITTTSWPDTNIVSTNSPYKFAVQAVDNNGNASAISSDITVNIPAPTCSSAPTAPTLNGAQNANTVSLTWTAITPPAGCTLQAYEVFRNSTALSPLVAAGITTFTDSNLAPGTYSYTVEAIDSNGPASVPSNSKSFTVTDTTPPTPPTVFTAIAQSPTQVMLSWSGATDNVGVTSYVISRSIVGDSKSGTIFPSISGSLSSYVDSTATASTQYIYSIQAVDAAQNVSTAVTAAVTTPAPTGQIPPVPTGLQSILVTSNFIALSWNASAGATSYTIVRTGPGSTTTQFSSSTNSFGDSGLANNTTYTYTVAAVNSAGSSSPSGGLSVQTLISSTTTLIGDINGDGKVNIFDLAILLSNWSKTNMTYQQGDLNGDGTVNIFDLGLMLGDWTG